MTILFSDNFNTGSFSGSWDTSNGTINAASALEGTAGWEIFATELGPGASVALAGGTVDGVAHFGFRLDFNDFVHSGGTGNPTDFLDLLNDPSGDLLDIDIIGLGGTALNLRFRHADDADTDYTITAEDVASNSDTWEAVITRASSDVAADGTFEVFKNGLSIGSQSSIDNWDIYNGLSSTQIFAAAIGGDGDSGSFYLDDIVLRDDDTQIFPATNTFRFLGMDNDSDTVYLTGTKDGDLKLYTYTLDGNFTESGTISFGAATDTEINNRERDLKPLVIADDVLYLYGRDGNNKQIQYTTGGTGAWTDVGAGTATWGTDKIAVGAGASPYDPDDILVGFRDDDIYQTLEATANWSKKGDMSGSIDYLSRHPNIDRILLAGGIANGTVLYSHNLGVSDKDISPGTTLSFSSNFTISESGDDGQATVGLTSWASGSGVIRSGNQSIGGAVETAHRYQNINIPKGATITDAYITFTANNGTSAAPDLIFYCEDADSATQISDYTDYNTRARTTASVTWKISGIGAGGTVQSPSFTAAVQEVIDRASWEYGNNLQVFLEDDGSTVNNYIDLASYDASPAGTKGGTLTIEWTIPIGKLEAVAWSL